MKKAIFAFIITSLMLVLSAQAFACEHALAAGIAGPDRAISSSAPGEDNLVASKDRKKAVLCSNCHTFKGGKEHCVKCGKWFAKKGGRAVLCSNCYDFKGGKDHCAKCGKWIGSKKYKAYLCDNCYNFKGGKDHCAKCGKWVP